MKTKSLNRVIERIATKIENTEFYGKTFVVGGFVRDKLLKNERKDIDFVVNLADGGIKLANYLYSQKNCSRPVIYKRFGTAMVQIGRHQVEFVMTRNESYEDKSRQPSVQFGDIREDAFRRDFTINALYYNISDKQIYDFTGAGLKDIENKIIRSTADPKLIFQEDPLRTLRALRFAGRLGFTIEDATWQGILEWAHYLEYISIERIKDEFVMMVTGAGAEVSLSLCFETKVMSYISPLLTENREEVVNLISLLHKLPQDLTLRLALLFSKISDYKRIYTDIIHLTISKKIARTIVRIVENIHQLEDYSTLSSLNSFVYNNLNTLPLALQIIEATNFSLPIKKKLEDKIEFFTKAKYPLNGMEVIESLELKSAKDISYYTVEARRIWVEEPELGGEEILSKLKRKK